MKIKVAMWVQNKYNPSVKGYLKAAQDKLFGNMNDSLMSMFGGIVQVGLNEEVNDQYGEMLVMSFGSNEPVLLQAIVKGINELEEKLTEKYDIPKDNFLYKISVDEE